MTQVEIGRAKSNAAAAQLLHRVFGRPRYASADYLDWYYGTPPEGPGMAWEARIDGALVGTVAAIPQNYWVAGKLVRLGVLANLAVDPAARGKGVSVAIGRYMARDALAAIGAEAIIAIANAKSTPGLVRRVGFRHVLSLPVVAGLARPNRSESTRSFPAAGGLDTPEILSIINDFDHASGAPVAPAWTSEKLRWRLSCPAAKFVLHANDDAMIVTKRDTERKLPVTIVVKVFKRRAATRAALRPLLRAACQTHRTRIYLHAGVSPALPIRGIPVPRRLLPSPLNLLYIKLGPNAPEPEAVRPEPFEFLDFDVY